MTVRDSLGALSRTARVAGALILIISVFAPFSMIYVPSALIVPGDATATAGNIVASEGLFRLGIASDSVVFLLEIVLVVMLYVLLRPVDATLSLVAAFARLAMTVVQGVNLLNSFAALSLARGAGYLAALEPDQLHALMLLFVDLHERVAIIWGLFFGLHLLVLGYLVYRSSYIASFVGALLVVASLCYLVQGFGNILLPQLAGTWEMIGFLSVVEIVLPLYLLIRGVRAEGLEGVVSDIV
jgi:hypothetical protein